MKITYDAQADAAYIYLTDKVKSLDTRHVDEDIALDFDGDGRLVGVEVLDAYERLDMDQLLPRVQVLGPLSPCWGRLKRELRRRKEVGQAVLTSSTGVHSWVDQVGTDYVVVLSEGSDKPHKVTAEEIQDGEPQKSGAEKPLISALRKLGGYPPS